MPDTWMLPTDRRVDKGSALALRRGPPVAVSGPALASPAFRRRRCRRLQVLVPTEPAYCRRRQVRVAVADPGLADHGLGEALHVARATMSHDCLDALVVVDVPMGGRHRQLIGSVLQAGEA